MTDSYEENRAHCKRIADELYHWYHGDVVRCPECGEFLQWEDVEDSDSCPECHEEVEFEACSLWDWYADEEFFDEVFHISADGTIRGVTLMVACGGPNIYINTQTMRVELYWWTDRADYPIDREVCEALDEIVSEYIRFKPQF